MGLRPSWLGVFAPLLALVPLTTVYFILFIRPELIVLSEEDRVQLAVERLLEDPSRKPYRGRSRP